MFPSVNQMTEEFELQHAVDRYRAKKRQSIATFNNMSQNLLKQLQLDDQKYIQQLKVDPSRARVCKQCKDQQRGACKDPSHKHRITSLNLAPSPMFDNGSSVGRLSPQRYSNVASPKVLPAPTAAAAVKANNGNSNTKRDNNKDLDHVRDDSLRMDTTKSRNRAVYNSLIQHQRTAHINPDTMTSSQMSPTGAGGQSSTTTTKPLDRPLMIDTGSRFLGRQKQSMTPSNGGAMVNSIDLLRHQSYTQQRNPKQEVLQNFMTSNNLTKYMNQPRHLRNQPLLPNASGMVPSGSQSTAPQNFSSALSQHASYVYDQHGRRSKSRGGAGSDATDDAEREELQRQQALIEDKYNAFQKSYGQLFRGRDAAATARQTLAQAADQQQPMLRTTSMVQGTGGLMPQLNQIPADSLYNQMRGGPARTPQHQSQQRTHGRSVGRDMNQGLLNNNYQNNINNSIILLQPGGMGNSQLQNYLDLSPLIQQQQPDLDLLKDQLIRQSNLAGVAQTSLGTHSQPQKLDQLLLSRLQTSMTPQAQTRQEQVPVNAADSTEVGTTTEALKQDGNHGAEQQAMSLSMGLSNELAQRAAAQDGLRRRAQTRNKDHRGDTYDSLPAFQDGLSSQSPGGVGQSSNDVDSHQEKLMLMKTRLNQMELLYKNLKRSARHAASRKRQRLQEINHSQYLFQVTNNDTPLKDSLSFSVDQALEKPSRKVINSYSLKRNSKAYLSDRSSSRDRQQSQAPKIVSRAEIAASPISEVIMEASPLDEVKERSSRRRGSAALAATISLKDVQKSPNKVNDTAQLKFMNEIKKLGITEKELMSKRTTTDRPYGKQNSLNDKIGSIYGRDKKKTSPPAEVSDRKPQTQQLAKRGTKIESRVADLKSIRKKKLSISNIEDIRSRQNNTTLTKKSRQNLASTDDKVAAIPSRSTVKKDTDKDTRKKRIEEATKLLAQLLEEAKQDEGELLPQNQMDKIADLTQQAEQLATAHEKSKTATSKKLKKPDLVKIAKKVDSPMKLSARELIPNADIEEQDVVVQQREHLNITDDVRIFDAMTISSKPASSRIDMSKKKSTKMVADDAVVATDNSLVVSDHLKPIKEVSGMSVIPEAASPIASKPQSSQEDRTKHDSATKKPESKEVSTEEAVHHNEVLEDEPIAVDAGSINESFEQKSFKEVSISDQHSKKKQQVSIDEEKSFVEGTISQHNSMQKSLAVSSELDKSHVIEGHQPFGAIKLEAADEGGNSTPHIGSMVSTSMIQQKQSLFRTDFQIREIVEDEAKNSSTQMQARQSTKTVKDIVQSFQLKASSQEGASFKSESISAENSESQKDHLADESLKIEQPACPLQVQVKSELNSGQRIRESSKEQVAAKLTETQMQASPMFREDFGEMFSKMVEQFSSAEKMTFESTEPESLATLRNQVEEIHEECDIVNFNEPLNSIKYLSGFNFRKQDKLGMPSAERVKKLENKEFISLTSFVGVMDAEIINNDVRSIIPDQAEIDQQIQTQLSNIRKNLNRTLVEETFNLELWSYRVRHRPFVSRAVPSKIISNQHYMDLIQNENLVDFGINQFKKKKMSQQEMMEAEDVMRKSKLSDQAVSTQLQKQFNMAMVQALCDAQARNNKLLNYQACQVTRFAIMFELITEERRDYFIQIQASRANKSKNWMKMGDKMKRGIFKKGGTFTQSREQESSEKTTPVGAAEASSPASSLLTRLKANKMTLKDNKQLGTVIEGKKGSKTPMASKEQRKSLISFGAAEQVSRLGVIGFGGRSPDRRQSSNALDIRMPPLKRRSNSFSKLKRFREKKLKQAKPHSKSEPGTESDDISSIASHDSCKIFYLSSSMITRIFDMDDLARNEEKMLLHLKMSQLMQAKVMSDLKQSLSRKFSLLGNKKGPSGAPNLGLLMGGGGSGTKTRRPSVVAKYEQFDSDKRNLNKLLDSFRDQCLEERELVRDMLGTLYERVGGKDRVWRLQSAKPVRQHSAKMVDLGYSCTLIDLTMAQVTDEGSSHLLMSTISFMSEFSQTSSLVAGESITAEGSTQKEPKRHLKELGRFDTQYAVELRAKNEDKLVDRYQEYTMAAADEEDKMSNGNSDEFSFFGDDDSDSSYYSESEMRSPQSSAGSPAQSQVSPENSAGKSGSSGSQSSSEGATFTLMPCGGLQEAKAGRQVGDGADLSKWICCDYNQLIAHINALVDEQEVTNGMAKKTLVSELQFLLYNTYYSLTPNFISYSTEVSALKRLDPREVAHEMELYDLQTTPSLHQIFMNYVQGVSFGPAVVESKLSWGRLSKKSTNNYLKVTQSALQRLKHYLQRELTVLKKQIYINCIFKSLLKFFSIRQYICSVVAPKQDFDAWVQHRIDLMRSETIYEQIQRVLSTSMDAFWRDDHYLLDRFLNTEKKQADQEQNSDQCESLFNDSSHEEPIPYRNPTQLVRMHGGKDPSPLLTTVLLKPNSQYEIFRVLSQSKEHKIKNKVILSITQNNSSLATSDTEPNNANARSGGRNSSPKLTSFRIQKTDDKVNQGLAEQDCFKTNYVQLLEMQLKRIKTMTIARMKDKHMYDHYLKEPSEQSSERDSEYSLEQTAKYIYFENLCLAKSQGQQQEAERKQAMLRDYRISEAKRVAKLRKQKTPSPEKLGIVMPSSSTKMRNYLAKRKLVQVEANKKWSNVRKRRKSIADRNQSTPPPPGRQQNSDITSFLRAVNEVKKSQEKQSPAKKDSHRKLLVKRESKSWGGPAEKHQPRDVSETMGQGFLNMIKKMSSPVKGGQNSSRRQPAGVADSQSPSKKGLDEVPELVVPQVQFAKERKRRQSVTMLQHNKQFGQNDMQRVVKRAKRKAALSSRNLPKCEQVETVQKAAREVTIQLQLIKHDARFTFNSGFRYGQKKKGDCKHTGNQSKDLAGLSPLESVNKSDDHGHAEEEHKDEPIIAKLKNGCLVNVSQLKQDLIHAPQDIKNKWHQARANLAVAQIQAIYDEFRRFILKQPSSSKGFYYKYRRQRLLREPEIDNLLRQHAIEKILAQKWHRKARDKERMHIQRAFSLDLSSRLMLKYINPFEVDPVHTKGGPQAAPGAGRARKEEQRRTRLLSKSSKDGGYQSAEVEKPLNYVQGSKCKCFKMQCKLVANCRIADKLRLDKELATTPSQRDILRYQNIIEPVSGAPIYMLFEVIEVSRKSREDIEAERARLTKLLDTKFRSQINYLQFRQQAK